MKENVFAKKYGVWYYTKLLILCFLVALMFTIAVSLVLGYKYKLVVTGSMEPTIKTHSMVLDSPTKFEDLKVGDIITFTSASGNTTITFTHRIIEINGDKITTKGDNSTQIDRTLVTKEMYVGKVVYYNYPIGAIVWYVKEHIIQVIIAVLVLYLEYVIIM